MLAFFMIFLLHKQHDRWSSGAMAKCEPSRPKTFWIASIATRSVDICPLCGRGTGRGRIVKKHPKAAWFPERKAYTPRVS